MSQRVAMTTLQYEGVKVRDAGRCARCGSHAPEGAWHHRRGKAVRDEHTHCSCNGIWLHHSCHTKVHAQPLIARNDGLIVSRISLVMPADVPVKHAGFGWVLLDCAFRYRVVDAPV